MYWWQAIILGIVEGITEFLPVSSTGHLTIVEKLMGMSLSDQGLVAFTAVIQIGAILAAIIYFRNDIWRILRAWWAGLWTARYRQNADYRFGWAIIIGSAPIAIVGLLFKSEIGTVLRSLWFVALALLGWSFVMWLADRYAKTTRSETSANWKDTLVIGLVQIVSLIPGISRSGATISAGLFRGFDRVAAIKLSFLLGIPALLAAGILQATTEWSNIIESVGWLNTLLATAVAFLVSYLTIAWLLKYIAHHNFSVFIWYRVGLGTLLLVLLYTGTLTST
ncbi:MAG: undecaprenyl-diphosphate phosphatase [Sphaerimonospora mesophila]